MKNKLILLLLFSISMITANELMAQSAQLKQIDWKCIAQAKDSSGKTSIGFAGPINGTTNSVFITAGGANFPDKMPWEGGKKHFSDEVHLLKQTAEGYSWLADKTYKLPEAIAYAGNTVTDSGIVYVGGENTAGISNKAYRFFWDEQQQDLVFKPLPNLPVALTNVALSHIGTVVYAVGGDAASHSSNALFSLDLAQPNPSWKQLANLPLALANATAVAQQDAQGEVLIYVIGGRSKTTSGISDLHATVFAYHPANDTWESKASIYNGKAITNLSAAAGLAVGKSYIVITGSDNGEVFHQIESFIAQIGQANSTEEKDKYTRSKNDLVIHHQGFDKSILLYNTQTNTWQKIGELPFFTPVTTTASQWGHAIILSNGEIKPGVRSPNVMLGNLIFE